MAVSVYVIWWALRGAKKLDVGHGDHVHEVHHGGAEPKISHESDDLTQIKGIGAVISAKLRTLGITSYEQIAGLNETDIERINGVLNFKGRIEKEQWIQQAQEILVRRG
jgi:predicted flap endonuclease-1-like 5' DNA nuclease